jgi:hypothetical protein
MAPVYPALMAVVFRLLGVYSETSAIVLLSINALTSALTCLPLVGIARRIFSQRTALWTGWTWAVFPYAIYFPMERLWETSLATLLLAVLFYLTLRLQCSPCLGLWVGYGALWGLGALTSPTLLAVFPFLAGWASVQLRGRGQEWRVPAIAMFTVFFVMISPWMLRDYHVFHKFIPLRDSFGLSLRLGTKGRDPSHWGPYDLGPWHNESEWQEFQQQGEMKYMEHKRHQAIEAIAADPGYFLWTSVRRGVFIWTGFWSLSSAYLAQEPLDLPNIPVCTGLTIFACVGLWKAFRRKVPEAWPVLGVLLFFPLIYYMTSPEAYYRRPIDPLLVLLAVYAFAKHLRPEHKELVRVRARGAVS